MPHYYARIEAINLSYSVYDTNDISTIRGGSFMVLNAFRNLEAAENGITVLSSNASEFLCKYSARDEKEANSIFQTLVNKIPAEVKSIASFVGGFCEVHDTDGFQKTTERLKAENRWQQYKMLSFPLPNVDQTAEQACSLDGVRPGVHEIGEDEIQSTAVFLRRKRGREFKHKIYKEILRSNWDEKFIESEVVGFTKHLEELSTNPKQGKLNGKIALIYLDGNRFGAMRDALCKDEDFFRQFQEHIQGNLRKPALKAVLDRAAGDANFQTQDGKIEFEMLMWGGDEIEWVVPAWQALSVLNIFYQEAAMHRTQENTPDAAHFTHSGGVVFCHHNLPILQIRQYARQLCDLVKEQIPKAFSELRSEHNQFAFLNMTAMDLLKGDVKAFMTRFHAPAKPQDFIICAEELPAIHQNMLVLKRFVSKTKLHELSVAVKSQNWVKAEDVWEDILKLNPRQKDAISRAKEHLVGKDTDTKWERWLSFTDLLDYVGEVL